MKKWMLVLICVMLTGCATKFVWTDDMVALSSGWVVWGKVDDLAIDVNGTHIEAGGSESHPDANAVKAAVTAVIGGL